MDWPRRRRRSLLVSHHPSRWHERDDPRRSGQEDAAGLRGCAARVRGRRRRRQAAAVARRPGGGGGGGRGGGASASPRTASRCRCRRDGTRGVFIRDWNLWVRDIATGQEKALTTDGVEVLRLRHRQRRLEQQRSRDRARGRPTRRRSPRSSRTSATSARCISCNTTVGHPTLRVSKFPLPGDPRRWRCCTASSSTSTPGTVTRLQMPPDFHRATLGDNISMNDYNWSPGRRRSSRSRRCRAITSTSWLRVADAATGAVRTVFDETVRDAVRVAHRLARAVGDERGHLALRARQLGPALSLRSADRAAEEPDHDRRRAGDADRAHRREDAHALVRRQRPRDRDRIRTSCTSIASASTARTSCR